MAFIKLQFKPGVNRDQTDYSNEGGWYECDKIRFRSGYPEKVGGWVKATPNTMDGVCRQMWNWITTFNDNFLALGTDEKVYIESGGYFNDITPFATALAGSNTFAVTTGVKLVTVTTTTALPSWLDSDEPVLIAGFASSLGGVPITELNGVRIVTVTGANSFTFPTTTTPTTDSVSGSGYTVQTEIEPGNVITVQGLGWGVGPWFPKITNTPPNNPRAWGLGSTNGSVFLPQRDWWFDNFDNDLVMNIRNGPGYWWVRGSTDDPSTALATHAITLQDFADGEGYDPNAVPSQIMQLLVSQQDKHLLAFGAVPFGSTSAADFDPLLIRWASQDSPGDWTPSVINTAGDLRISRGSKIIRALPTRQEILVWTDTNLYTLQFLGTTDVFGLQEYADNISVASPRAMASAANITYWMGQDKFYAYTGRVETLPCTLRNHVFNNLNYEQTDQIVCGTNEQWNEVWWFYPAYGEDYNNAYVVYNHLERIWYYGTIDRTAWLDTPLRPYPQAANSAIITDPETNLVTTGPGYLYNHEDGVDDDGTAMISYIQSSDFDLDDGDQFMLTRRILPDVGFDGSTQGTTPEVTLTVRPRNFPGSTFSADAADTQRVIETSVGVYTDQVFMRARARQMAFKIRSENLGVQWQLGAPRLDARPDGRR
jgi:hypothetical protein